MLPLIRSRISASVKGGSGFRQVLGDVTRRARAALAQHAHSGTDLSRRAITALITVVLDERRLHRMQVLPAATPRSL